MSYKLLQCTFLLAVFLPEYVFLRNKSRKWKDNDPRNCNKFMINPKPDVYIAPTLIIIGGTIK